MPVQRSTSVEDLPAEIRREILHILHYDSLRALTHASPTFHQQYRPDRGSLLRGCLQRTLGAATVDVCAAYRSNPDSFPEERSRESVAKFLKLYQDRRYSATYSILDEALGKDEIVGMAAFHFTVIEPLLKRFTNWALDHLASKTGGLPHHKPLSTTEEARIMRAMYRFQLCCFFSHERRHLFRRPDLDSTDLVTLFFCLFESWEVEEVNNPRFADQHPPPTPTGAFNFDNSWERSAWLEGTVLSGFELLHSALFKMRDHEHLVTTMQDGISLGGELFEFALSDVSQSERRREHPSERDLKQEARDPLPFVGDLVPDAARGSCPPLAWTLIWKGTYSNLYGDYLGDVVRCWAYVMWDAAQLAMEKGKALLLKAWFYDQDPRDSMF